MIATILVLGIIMVINADILSIDVLALSAILLIVAYRYKRKTRMDPYLYILATVLAVTAFFIDLEVIRHGVIGFSMMNVVMFTGVLPNQWSISKKLKSYRSLYSILGVLFILPHGYINLFVDQEINMFGIAGLVIMLPLFLTSFNFVRKGMKVEEWVKVQKAAYLVYILLFAHLILMADWVGKILYAVMMTLYINNKLIKEFKK